MIGGHYLASSYEDGTLHHLHRCERRQREQHSFPSPARCSRDLLAFQDSDLIATVMPNTLPPPTEGDDDWIPDIQIEPNSLAFKLIWFKQPPPNVLVTLEAS